MTRLLVSVRSAAEAREARLGGADLLDAKEPAAGALGAVSPGVLADILAEAAGLPVSAALGELSASGPLPEVPEAVAFVKVGLAGWRQRDWPDRLLALRCPRLVVTAYADHERADAPPTHVVLDVVLAVGLTTFLIDTWGKDGSSLLDWLSSLDLAGLLHRTRSAGVRVALAGSLTAEAIAVLRELEPDWFAVRGAACDGGRDGAVSRDRVAALAALVRGP